MLRAAPANIELEIILVDDCSTDETSEVIAGLANTDTRVKTISKTENEGVSKARNSALDVALGDYVFFLDADDVVLPGVFALLHEHMVDDVDFVRAKHFLWDPDTGSKRLNEGEELNFNEVHGIEPDAYPQIGAIYSSWNALIRRSVIQNNELRFDPRLKLGEDRLFNAALLRKCRRITLLNEYTYKWRTPSSETNQATQICVKNPEEVFVSIRCFSEQLKDDWYTANPKHREFIATSMAVELSNFMASFSRVFDAGELSSIAKDHLGASFDAIESDWVNLRWRSIKGRTDVFEGLYQLVGDNVGSEPSEEFLKQFFTELGKIRAELNRKAKTEEDRSDQETIIAAGRSRRVLGAAFQQSRDRRGSEFLEAEKQLLIQSKTFDHAYYRKQYPDVAAAGADALLHYLQYGASELRNPNAWFDTAEYFSEHPELFAAGINPLSHYLRQSSYILRR